MSQYRFWPQLGIAVDQLLNVFPCFGWADETLSARAYRSREKAIGGFMLPVIDFLFLWQTPDVMDEADQPIRSHCHRAYLKEKTKRGLPPEYRE